MSSNTASDGPWVGLSDEVRGLFVQRVQVQDGRVREYRGAGDVGVRLAAMLADRAEESRLSFELDAIHAAVEAQVYVHTVAAGFRRSQGYKHWVKPRKARPSGVNDEYG